MKKLFYYFIAGVIFSFSSKAQTSIINKIAGTPGISGYSGDSSAANTATLNFPTKVANDASGNIYFADNGNNAIRKIATTGIITTIVGNGTAGYSGDGGPATSAIINTPWGVAVYNGDIYFCDQGNQIIRKIDGVTGIISRVAGTPGVAGFSGDSGLAINATLNYPTGLAIDNAGNIYITDDYNNRVRKVNTSGIITTFAGTGVGGFGGDTGPATSAQISFPAGISADVNGNVYISDNNNQRIRKINTSGIITTVAGNGTAGYNGDGILATNAFLNSPWDAVADAAGNIYIADFFNCRVRKVDITTGFISTYAGSSCGYGGDGGPATSAKMNAPTGLCLNNNGDLIIVDAYSNILRKVFTTLTAIPSICYLDPATCNWTDLYSGCTATLNLYQGCSTKLTMCGATYSSGGCGNFTNWFSNGQFYGTTTQANPNLNFSSNTTGTFQITFIDGPCPNQCSISSPNASYLTINVIPKPNYLFTANPNPVCVGNQIIFTTNADDQNLYPGSATTNGLDFGDGSPISSGSFNNNTGLTTYIHTYTSAGTYNVTLGVQEYYNCFPCTDNLSMTIVVNSSPPVCTTPPVFPCGNGGQPINLNPYFSPPGGIFTSQTGTIAGTLYTPNPGNQYGSNNFVVYNNGCGVCTTQIFIDPPFCQDWQNINNPNNKGGGTINSSQTWSAPLSNPFYVYGNYTITGAGTVLTISGQFLMSPGYFFHVTGGATLKIVNGWMHACCNMWPGITVDGGGTVDMQTGINVIEDAVAAITILPGNSTNPLGGKFVIGDLAGTSHTVFNKNTEDILVEGIHLQPSSTVYNSFVYGSIFTCRNLQSTGLYTNLNTGSFNNLQNSLNAYPAVIPYPPTTTIAGVRTKTGIHFDNISNDNTHYLNVGTPGNKIKNFFDNLDYGILCLNTTLRVQNNRFQFLKELNTSSLHGIGIYAKLIDANCELTIGYNNGVFQAAARNEFRDCFYGTHITNYKTVYHDGNIVENSLPANLICLSPPCVNSGAFAVFQNSFPQSNTFKFEGNTIHNAGIGIYVNIANSFQNNLIAIEGNHIDQTINGPTNMFGAWVEYGAGNNTNGNVLVNNNSIRNSNNICLYFRNIKGSATSGLLVNQNTELSVSRISSNTKYAVGIDNCEYAVVRDNKNILTSSNNGGVIPNHSFQNQQQGSLPFNNGVFILNSPNTLTSCNEMRWLDADLFYRGSCFPSLFLNNTFDQSQIGYWLDGNTSIIGTQIDAGPLPIGDLWGKYQTRITFAQTFVTNNAVPSNSPLYTGPFSNGGLTEQPDPLGNKFFVGTPYGPGSIFLQPGTAQGCGTNGGGNGHRVGQITNLRSNLQIQLTNSAMDVSDNFHRNMFAYRTIKNDNNQVGYLTDNYLANFYNGSSNSNHALMANTLDAISAHNISAAQANVSAMQPGTPVEQDFKTVQTIALNKMADSTYHFTPADSVALSVIASKCVFESGIAVTQARALLAAITQSPVFYTDNCVSYGGSGNREVANTSNLEISETDFIKLYPNPNNGSFTVEYKLEKTAMLEVRDIQGKVVCKKRLEASQNGAAITCENLENGVYLYKVITSEFETISKKLVIVK